MRAHCPACKRYTSASNALKYILYHLPGTSHNSIGAIRKSTSFLSSISMLTMRLLQGSSRPLCFWSLHQSWLSRSFSPSGLPRHCPSRSCSASLCLSFHSHVHVKLRLVVFPSIRSTYPNHRSILFLIFSATVS